MWAAYHHLHVTNNSYFAAPWLFNCRNDAGQRAIWKAEQRAIRYAQQQGVVVVAAEGNENIDLSKQNIDSTSPDDGTPITREVTNASLEITTSTTDLSQRTEEQAASLEETSATLEEIAFREDEDRPPQVEETAHVLEAPSNVALLGEGECVHQVGQEPFYPMVEHGMLLSSGAHSET